MNPILDLFGVKQPKLTLTLKVSRSEAHCLLTVAEEAIKDAIEHKEYCSENGLWVAVHSWEDLRQAAESLRDAVKKLI